MVASNIWLLRANGDNKYMSVVGYRWSDRKYTWTHFSGERISDDDWQLPQLDIVGKSKKLGDFVGGMLEVPIISEKAKALLVPLVGDDVQFLPFHDLRRNQYYVMNVLRVEDYLDEALSEGQTAPDGKRYNFSRHVFKSDLPDELPPIFKTRSDSLIFVTRRFVDVIVDNKLTGACLQDPGEDAIRLMAHGKSLNAYPGLS